MKSDLASSHHAWQEDFTSFLAHVVKPVEAFQLVESGPTCKRRRQDESKRSGNDPIGSTTQRSTPGLGKLKLKRNRGGEGKNGCGGGKVEPFCLWEAHMKQGIRRLLKSCPDCPDSERHCILKDRADEKARTGPACSTQSQVANRTAGRLAAKPIAMHTSLSRPVVVSDGTASMNATGRYDDDSNDSNAFSLVVQKAVLKGIGRLEAIKPIAI